MTTNPLIAAIPEGAEVTVCLALDLLYAARIEPSTITLSRAGLKLVACQVDTAFQNPERTRHTIQFGGARILD
jgi:hypothetical protein